MQPIRGKTELSTVTLLKYKRLEQEETADVPQLARDIIPYCCSKILREIKGEHNNYVLP